MSVPRKVVVSRADRAKVLREALRDESKVRVSLEGLRKAAHSEKDNRPMP